MVSRRASKKAASENHEQTNGRSLKLSEQCLIGGVEDRRVKADRVENISRLPPGLLLARLGPPRQWA